VVAIEQFKLLLGELWYPRLAIRHNLSL
jgi:hypothetical protein